MPYINVKTNAEISKKTEVSLKSSIARAMEESFPGKTENWLMVNIEGFCTMYLGGSDLPCAMFEVSIFGEQSDSAYAKLTEKLCAIAENELKVSPDRVYVKYGEYTKWGWNNMNL